MCGLCVYVLLVLVIYSSTIIASYLHLQELLSDLPFVFLVYGSSTALVCLALLGAFLIRPPRARGLFPLERVSTAIVAHNPLYVSSDTFARTDSSPSARSPVSISPPNFPPPPTPRRPWLTGSFGADDEPHLYEEVNQLI